MLRAVQNFKLQSTAFAVIIMSSASYDFTYTYCLYCWDTSRTITIAYIIVICFIDLKVCVVSGMFCFCMQAVHYYYSSPTLFEVFS